MLHQPSAARSSSRSSSSSSRSRPTNVVESELAARITEQCFYNLESPVLRVGGFDTPYPASRIEEEWLPDIDRVLDAVDRTMSF